MGIEIRVYTTRRAEHKLRKAGKWFRYNVLPVIGWALRAITCAAGASAVFFACGLDSADLVPVVQGLLLSLGVMAGSAFLRWIIE